MEQVAEQITRAVFAGNTIPWHLISDQNKFLSEVETHDIGPLMVYKMESLPSSSCISEFVSDELQRMARHQLVNDTLIEKELIRVLQSLGRSSVRALVMKGSALSMSIYPRQGLLLLPIRLTR